jgi:MFS transporter, OFA family, oxalate/formate antiporter
LLTSCVPFGIFVAFHFKEYGGIFIKDDYYLSILGSMGSVANGGFRMLLGVTMDLVTFRKLMVASILVFMLSSATIVFSVHNKVTYFMTIVFTYGCYGGLYSIFPTQNVRMLGKVIGAKMYYITFLGFSTGAIIQYVFHRTLVEKYKDDGYTYCFIIFGSFLLVGLFLVLKVDFALH